MAVSRTQRFKWWMGRSGKAPKPEYAVGETSTKGGLYGVKGDPTKGGMYMAEASGSSSSGEGTSPVVAEVIASHNQKADFNLTPVQKVGNAQKGATNLMKAVNSSPGEFYVSDVKLIQREDDIPGIFTPVVDVAIAQENVPLSDATPLGANNAPGRTVWQDVQVAATSLEKASVKNPNVVSSGELPDNWQSGMTQAKAGGAAVTSAQNTANFSQALESHSKSIPYVIAHLRPGNYTAADGDEINQDYLPPEFKQNLIPGSMAASAPVADIYVVSANALDDRAGNLRYVESFDYDDEPSKPLGGAAYDGALLAAYAEGDHREAQKGLATNYNLNEFDNPFGGKVGKFVELKGVSADGTLEKPDINTLKNAEIIEVGFKLNAKDSTGDSYKPLPGGYKNFYGKVFAGSAVGEKSKVVIPTLPPRPAEPGNDTVAGVMRMGGRPRGDYLRQTEGKLKGAATTDKHYSIIKDWGQPRPKKKGKGGK